VNLVADIFAERVEVGATLRQFKRDVAGNNRGSGAAVVGRRVGRTKNVQVGIIGQRVIGNQWSFAVARGFKRVVLATPASMPPTEVASRAAWKRGRVSRFFMNKTG